MHTINNMKQKETVKKIDSLITSLLDIDYTNQNLTNKQFEDAVISTNKAVVTLEELQETISEENKK